MLRRFTLSVLILSATLGVLLLCRWIWIVYPSFFTYRAHNKTIQMVIDQGKPVIISYDWYKNGEFHTKRIVITEKHEKSWFLSKFHISSNYSYGGSMLMRMHLLRVMTGPSDSDTIFRIACDSLFYPIPKYKFFGGVKLNPKDSSELRDWLQTKGFTEEEINEN